MHIFKEGNASLWQLLKMGARNLCTAFETARVEIRGYATENIMTNSVYKLYQTTMLINKVSEFCFKSILCVAICI